MNSPIKYLARRFFCTASPKKEEELDFVQKLFLQFVKEYYTKLKENQGKLFDIPSELAKERDEKVKILLKSYAGDMSEEQFETFPQLTFQEPVIDTINLEEKGQTAEKQKKK